MTDYKGNEIIGYCFNQHIKDIGGDVFFSFDEYMEFWVNHEVGNIYSMKNRDKSVVDCGIAYYPLPYYKDLRALIEFDNNGVNDLREVPVKFLSLNKKAGLSTGPT